MRVQAPANEARDRVHKEQNVQKNEGPLSYEQLSMFLQRSRDLASLRYASRMSQLETQYASNLRASLLSGWQAPDSMQVGGEYSKSESIDTHDVPGTYEENVVEIYLSENTHTPSSKASEPSPLVATNTTCLAHTTPSSPQSLTDSFGISPLAETPTSHLISGGSLHVASSERVEPTIWPSDSEGVTVGVSLAVTTSLANDSVTSCSQQTPSNVAPALRKAEASEPGRAGYIPISLRKQPVKVVSEAVRCTTADPQGPCYHSTITSAPLWPQESELREFLEWKTEMCVKKQQRLVDCAKSRSLVAKLYGTSQPIGRWLSSLGDTIFSEAPAAQLTPNSPPSHFIDWVATGLDCYEDLLLLSTPASVASWKFAISAIADVVLDNFIAECVFDSVSETKCNVAQRQMQPHAGVK